MRTLPRQHDGDYLVDDEQIHKMLAEKIHDSYDGEILLNFGLSDLDKTSLEVYRQRYNNLHPNAPLNDISDEDFLIRIGGFRIDRTTGTKGLTKAGLLMFGMHHAIREIFPNYLVDYQERDEPSAKARWIDRIVPDGKWSGNLFDFYRRVEQKLTIDLKIPFKLIGGVRREDTPIHVALREALVNTLVHADYTDRISVLVVKRPDLFGFRNPGLMRVPIEQSFIGGVSDARNKTLHQMFRMVNLGEQAGSGIPKILSSWKSQQWIPPSLYEKREPSNQTLLELKKISLLPENIIIELKEQFGEDFLSLSEDQRMALVIAKLDGEVTHTTLSNLSTAHNADITKQLQYLVKNQFLQSHGMGRGTIYTLYGTEKVEKIDIFSDVAFQDSIDAHSIGDYAPSIEDYAPSIEDYAPSIGDYAPSIGDNRASLIKYYDKRDSDGCLIIENLDYPIIDRINYLSENYRVQLYQISAPVSQKQRVAPTIIREVILALCTHRFISLSSLAKLLDRHPDTIKIHVSFLLENNELRLAFPTTPRHNLQAYSKNEVI